MHRATTNRDYVLSVLGAARHEVARGTRSGFTTPTVVPSEVEPGPSPDALLKEIDRALEWAVNDETRLYLDGQIEDLGHGDMYLSQDPIISLVQSAIEEYGDSAPAKATLAVAATDAGDIIDVVVDKVKCWFKSNAHFTWPTDTTDFHFELAQTSKVVLVADWGTGSSGAKRVAAQIRNCEPDHVIHLGDIYPSGTESEARKHFVDVWKAHGPANAKYWALNGNHEMICRGTGYIEVVLPFCKQPASCFSLGNEHWRLIGLDTAYENHDLHTPQHEWLRAKLKPGGPKNILLTHHQPFSAVDHRPSSEQLLDTMRQFLDTRHVHGWFWGHEHGCLIYEINAAYWNARFRCIGHGGKDIRRPYYTTPKFPAPGVSKSLELPRTGETKRARNGFALLTFEGPQLDVLYIDEEGGRWETPDIWADAHGHDPML